jgi:group II intron reverse transcriptase/maturase
MMRPLRPPAGAIRPAPAPRFFTPEALQRAWLAVKRAGGGAGMDGVTLAAFERQLDRELGDLRAELAGGSYQPRPLRQVLVPKESGGWRELALWALRDRVAQRALYDIIAPAFEPHFLPCSFGFRPGLGVQDAVRQVSTYRDQGLRWVVDGDIKECFASIPTGPLLRRVGERVLDPLLRRYVRCWLEARIMNSADGAPRKAGASQGSVLSPLLANIYLHQVDTALTGRRLALVRYADDFVICCPDRRAAEAAERAAGEALARCSLAIHPQKTRVVNFDQGFAWLGHFLVRDECYVL